MRPGDAANLAATVSFLQATAGMQPLPNGRLRGYLGTFSGYQKRLNEISARVNRPGYSQHLVGVELLLMQKLGADQRQISETAGILVEKNPGNAFYMVLAGSPKNEIEAALLQRCPKSDADLVQPLFQWQWERENSDKAWLHSSLWDCIFAKRLAGI